MFAWVAVGHTADNIPVELFVKAQHVMVLHYPQHRGLTRASICFHLLWPTCDSLSLSSVTSDKAFSISSFVFPFPSPPPLVSVLWRFLVDANFYVRDFRSIQHAWADGKILSSKKKKYFVCSGHTTMEGAWSLCCRGLTLTTRALARLPRIKAVLAETFFFLNFSTHFLITL